MAIFEDRDPDPGGMKAQERPERDVDRSERWSLWRPSAIIPLLACLPILAGFGGAIYLAQQTPDVDDLGRSLLAEATTVYTADGQILTKYYEENRNWVPLDSISENVIRALLVTEDERFYEHWGIDVQRTISAIFRTAGGDTQGGSTITMQLVRNVYPDIADDPDLLRKAKEWLTSLKIEYRYEKDEILELYLNTVPFLYNAYGIDAAGRTYFGQPAHKLGILESATLIGMLKGPTRYNPVRHPERSRERRNVVLQLMAGAGYLSQQQYASLSRQETPLNFSPVTHEDNLAPYFAEYLRQWLGNWAKERGYDIYKDGLQVYSTIDAGMQQAAEKAVTEQGRVLQAVVDYEWSRPGGYSLGSDPSRYLSASGYEPFAYFWRSQPEVLDRLIKLDATYRALVDDGMEEEKALEMLKKDEVYVDSLKKAMSRLEIGFVAIDPHNGHIKAWVGGRDYSINKFDHVALSKRQSGSTFKPFVYATALANGYSQNTVLPDVVKVYVNKDTGQEWAPCNYEGASGRLMTLRDALAYSKNTITAQLVVNIGPERVAETARRMGIKSKLDEVPSIGLGTSPVSLLEMTTAYMTLANNGAYTEPMGVTRILDKNGKVLAQFESRPKQVISAQVAYGTLDMMRGVVQKGTGTRIRSQYGARGDLAAKTGTTQNSADGWFMLIHPDLVMGSWVGFSSPLITFRSSWWGQGAHNALHVVGSFVKEVGLSPDARFKAPSSYMGPGQGYTLPPPPRPSVFRAQGGPDDYEAYARGGVGSGGRRLDPLPLDNGVDPGRFRRFPGNRASSTPDIEAAQPGFSSGPESEVSRLNRQERESNNLGQVLEKMRRRKQESGAGN